jgi:hypothetical protein
MATEEAITIPLDLATRPTLLRISSKRTTYDDCIRHSNRLRKYPDGRAELDVMWSAVKLIENQFAEAGFAPR